ncbi:hypothetical protein LZ31DRAFT_357179 [Colletotrichum somersetense]|nr:hypothetical protein LZ31DRAFT_357179 [Colletotrichum somersetense]
MIWNLSGRETGRQHQQPCEKVGPEREGKYYVVSRERKRKREKHRGSATGMRSSAALPRRRVTHSRVRRFMRRRGTCRAIIPIFCAVSVCLVPCALCLCQHHACACMCLRAQAAVTLSLSPPAISYLSPTEDNRWQ